MKKGFFCSLLLFVFTSAISQVQTGIELGLINSNYNSSNMYTREKISLKTGVFINSSLFDKTGRDIWETGIYYQRKGAKLTNFEDNTTNYIQTLNTVFDYVQVPLMTGYKFAISKKVNFSLKIGLYGGYAFSATGDLKGLNDNGVFQYKISKLLTTEQFEINNQNYILKKFTHWDFGSIVALDFAFFKNKFFIRYTIENGGINLSGYDKGLKNRVESIGIAYNFM